MQRRARETHGETEEHFDLQEALEKQHDLAFKAQILEQRLTRHEMQVCPISVFYWHYRWLLLSYYTFAFLVYLHNGNTYTFNPVIVFSGAAEAQRARMRHPQGPTAEGSVGVCDRLTAEIKHRQMPVFFPRIPSQTDTFMLKKVAASFPLSAGQ